MPVIVIILKRFKPLQSKCNIFTLSENNSELLLKSSLIISYIFGSSFGCCYVPDLKLIFPEFFWDDLHHACRAVAKT
jgi:hypothetical protein